MRERHNLSEVDPIERVAMCSICGPTGIYRAGLNSAGDPKYRCGGRGPGRVNPNPRARHTLSNVDEERETATCAVCGPDQAVFYRSNGGAGRRTWRCGYTAWTGSHGLTRGERQAFIDKHGEFCDICWSLDPKTSLGWNVDHCHKTGKIRGLLCRPCNQGLGKFQDDPTFLKAAADYLLENQDA